jgi:hypothetical protein
VFILFRTIYLQLRAWTQAYIQQGVQPYLTLSQPPTGAFDWVPQARMAREDGIKEVKVEYDWEE